MFKAKISLLYFNENVYSKEIFGCTKLLLWSLLQHFTTKLILLQQFFFHCNNILLLQNWCFVTFFFFIIAKVFILVVKWNLYFKGGLWSHKGVLVRWVSFGIIISQITHNLLQVTPILSSWDRPVNGPKNFSYLKVNKCIGFCTQLPILALTHHSCANSCNFKHVRVLEYKFLSHFLWFNWYFINHNLSRVWCFFILYFSFIIKIKKIKKNNT